MKHSSRNTITGWHTLPKLCALSFAALYGSSPVSIAVPTTGTYAVYTSTADFNLGTYLNTNATTVANQVQFNQTITPFPFVYIAVSARGTLVRIDVDNGNILGEYWTLPDGNGRDPSRTTVDQVGNVWVTNRAESGESPAGSGQLKGSITRVGLIIGGIRVDANKTPNPIGDYLMAPFQYNTCVDRNKDGLIKTSRGLGDIRPWANNGGVDTHGGVKTAEDECIINYTRVTGTHTRTVAVDINNDIWVGGDNNKHEKLSGITGQPLPDTQFNLGCGGYGGLMDKFGVLWSARYGNNLLRFVPNFNPNLGPVPGTGACLNPTHGNYGLALDPKTCHVWHTTDFNPIYDLNNPSVNGEVVEMAKDGTVLHRYPHGYPIAQGVVVDGDSNVWVAHSKYADTSVAPATTVGHLKTNGTFVGNVPLVDSINGAFGSGPTGVAVDTRGKIWVANFYTNNVMRIDPRLGPNGGGGFPIGAVNLTVDLGSGAFPYNYSDMTGQTAIGNPTQGFWEVVHNGLTRGTSWGTITWNTEPEGRQPSITVEARAADTQAALVGPFIPVTSGVPFNLTGQFIQVHVSLKTSANADCVENPGPILSDLKIQAVCYLDGDSDVDSADVAIIFNNRGKKATGGNPPGDIDHDGLITINDARACVLQCTRPRCATQ